MSDETEYEITYTLRRRLPGEDDFTDIGFGASSAWSTPDQCAHIVSSDIDNYQWETEPGMPKPEQVEADLEGTTNA